jgi:hypothetical protein
MQTFIGMILGALLLVCGVYVYDSAQTSSVANGQTAAANRTIVNWDVAAADWQALKTGAHNLKTRANEEWSKIASK